MALLSSGSAIINDGIVGAILTDTSGAYSALPVASASAFGGDMVATKYLSSSFAGKASTIIDAINEVRNVAANVNPGGGDFNIQFNDDEVFSGISTFNILNADVNNATTVIELHTSGGASFKGGDGSDELLIKGPSMTFTADTGESEIVLTDGLADALSITDGSTDFMKFDTSGESITVTPALSASAQLVVAGAAEVAGATVLNGAVTLGNATSDDITVTGYVASSIIPKTDDASDLGTNALAWKDLYLAGKLDFNGATGENEVVLVDGLADALSITDGATDFMKFDTSGESITVTPALSASAQLVVAGAAEVAGATVLNGAVTLGNATSDDITVTGYVASSIIPKTDDASDLGTNALAWKDLYLAGKLDFNGATGENEVVLVDGLADALSITDGATDFMKFDTSGESITVTPALSASAQLVVAGAAEVAGATVLNGAVTLGNATSDDITVEGYVASDIIPKTNDAADLGATGQAWKDAYLTEELIFEGAASEDGKIVVPDNQALALQIGPVGGAYQFMHFDSTTGAPEVTFTPTVNFPTADVNIGGASSNALVASSRHRSVAISASIGGYLGTPITLPAMWLQGANSAGDLQDYKVYISGGVLLVEGQ